MNLSSIISIVKGGISLAGGGASIFSGGLTGLTIAGVKSQLGPMLSIFEELGSAIAPAAAPDVHGVIGFISAVIDGDEVLAAQRATNEVGRHIKGYTPIVEDGQYGPQTAAGVMAIETFLGLKPDSWYGPILAKGVELFLSTGKKPAAA